MKEKTLKTEALLNILEDLEEAKKELKKEKDLLKKYIDVAGVMIIGLDVDGYVVLVNNKAKEILNDKNIIGKKWIDNYIPKDERKKVLEVFKKHILDKNKKDAVVENHVLTKDKKLRLIHWHNVSLKDEKGKIIGTLSSGEDITKEKKTELKLISLEKKYEALLENFPIGIYSFDKKGIIDYFNPKMMQISGSKKEKVLGLNIFKMKSYHDAGLIKYFKKALKGNKFNVKNIHYKSSFSNKETFRNYTGIPIFDENNNVERVLLVVDDVTKDRLIKSNLKLKENFIINIIDNAGIPIITLNDETLFINKEFKRLTGYSEKEIKNRDDFLKLLFPSKFVKKKIEQSIRKVLRGSNIYDFVTPIMCKNKASLITVSNITPLKGDKNKIIGIILSLRNLSEIFKLEDQIKFWAANGFTQVDPETHKEAKRLIEISKPAKKTVKRKKYKQKKIIKKQKKRGGKVVKKNKNRN